MIWSWIGYFNTVTRGSANLRIRLGPFFTDNFRITSPFSRVFIRHSFRGFIYNLNDIIIIIIINTRLKIICCTLGQIFNCVSPLTMGVYRNLCRLSLRTLSRRSVYHYLNNVICVQVVFSWRITGILLTTHLCKHTSSFTRWVCCWKYIF